MSQTTQPPSTEKASHHTSSTGMGRKHSEAIDENSPISHVSFGVPDFNEARALMQTDSPSLHFVAYTDGGCRPSRGAGGYGFHGYLHTNSEPKQGAGAPVTPTNTGYLTKKDPKKAVEVVHYIDRWASIEGETTNNVAELKATIDALNYADQVDALSVILWIDSQYVKDGLEQWIDGWIANGWVTKSGKDVSNKELWLELLAAKERLEQKPITVKLEKVKGHDGDLGNTIADTLATRGVFLARKGRVKDQWVESPAKGYWNIKAEHNRMLSKSKWYFNTNMSASEIVNEDGYYVYHLGKHGPDDHMLGKPISDASFSVVFCAQPDPALEAIRRYQDQCAKGQGQRVMIGQLDTIQQPKHYQDLVQYGDDHLDCPGPHLNLVNGEEALITKEQRPARLAHRAIDTLVDLETLLGDVMKGSTGQNVYWVKTDITDQLFERETNAKGKTKVSIKKELGVGSRAVESTINYDVGHGVGEVTATLVLDMDLPGRNMLSALAKNDPKVWVISWRESDDAFRIATVVQAASDIGIWSSVYSNLRVLNPKRTKTKVGESP